MIGVLQSKNAFQAECLLIKDQYTAISRTVVGKSVHATIPKGNMGYDQYTVPDRL